MAFFLEGAVAPVSSKVYIDIDSPSMQKFPIAITDFVKQGGAADRENTSMWFADQLARALKITGYFNIIEKSAFLEKPGQGALTSASIRFADWSVIGAESLVKGSFQYSGRELSADFLLFDVIQGKLIAGKKYTGQIQDRKNMVLKFAGEILYTLTGERGVFDTKIAFAGKKGRISDIFTIDYDGSNLLRVTNHKNLSILPNWSPDGKYITFTSYKNANPDLYIVNSGGGREKKLSEFKGLNLSGPWSPDGRSLLLTLSKDGNEEIYILNTQDGSMKRLTYDPAIDVSPAWSPDGGRIAFVSDRAGTPQIYIMDADGANVRRLTFEGNYNTSPRWSPRGDRIVFESMKNGNFQICTIDTNGGNLVQLTSRGRNESPSWSPDGRYIAFVSTVSGRAKIMIMNSNGSNMRVLHEGMDNYLNTCWSPHLNFD
ncbi:MAG: Tol-Pal system beta propeller repeat protein TolB [Syntrophales bacterium]